MSTAAIVKLGRIQGAVPATMIGMVIDVQREFSDLANENARLRWLVSTIDTYCTDAHIKGSTWEDHKGAIDGIEGLITRYRVWEAERG